MTQFKKNAYTFLFIIIAYTGSIAQQTDMPIVKVTYTSSPISQYNMTEKHMRETSTKASLYKFMQGITDYYSLYINLKDRSSLYVLDSTEQVRPRGWEDPSTTTALADTVLFSIKTPKNVTFKHEWIMNQTFFSEGQVGDIEWEITNEERIINGLKCLKAIAENYPMLSVWYTKEIPVSNGPSIYQGLPGLVVYAEDFFRTIQISKIEYSNDVEAFKKLYETKYQEFQKEKQRHYAKEPILLIKKGDLAKALYEHFYGKPYKKG